MEDEEVRRMTVEEIALVREVVKWRRNHGVLFFKWRRGVAFGVLAEWKKTVDGRQRNVSVEFDPPRIVATEDYYHGAFRALPVGTVTEAVDVLVALGYLPPRFSTAYRKGWDASMLWHNVDPNDAVQVLRHNALFHDPLNVSFPAVDAAW